MEILLKHIKLYTINEVLLNLNSKFNFNLRYVIAVFINNNLTTLYLNYKFDYNSNYEYTFSNCYYFHNFIINEHNIDKTIVFELTHDFKYCHLMDLLLTHYNKVNKENTNTICINLGYSQAHKHKYKSNDKFYILK